jgi:hypothetical protein
MNMCESYLTKTYLKISGASSCRCIGIAGCLRYNQESFTWIFRKNLGYLIKSSGEGALDMQRFFLYHDDILTDINV